MTDDQRLRSSDLPELFRVADAASLEGQRLYIRGTRLRLVLAVTAAVLAAASLEIGDGWDLPALMVAVVFLGTLVLEIWLLGRSPERDWYDGRALAESVKTLSWRYAVAAAPFSASLTDEDAERHYVSEAEKLIDDAPATSVIVTGPLGVTDAMRGLRHTGLTARRDLYLKNRIGDQLTWYSTKARFNADRARRWRLALILIEALGLIVAVLRASGVVDVDLPGILAALLGAGTAWLAVRQYDAQARAYAFAAKDLGTIHNGLRTIDSETEWAVHAADAEEAISREHTMWRASRGAYGG
ncbi:DUF4231 domain-containing protein [Streptomyces rubrogriseus]|uniref:DUF4231 domain-containing protein n=1 Tax=Streptomyces rubrogriseus TaxID=194673 RepID=UPI000D59037C|nr:DUF4231 domain-containing protein [Streptomyces rubrogriseus]